MLSLQTPTCSNSLEGERFFYNEFVSRWNCHSRTDLLMKKPTAKGSEPRLVQVNLGSTAQQLCDHGHVIGPQFLHLWSGDKKSTILHVVRVDKRRHTCRSRSLRENAFLHVLRLSLSTSGGSVSHWSATPVIGCDALWDSAQGALLFINSCHLPIFWR